MKKFKKMKITLFDSVKAGFKVEVEGSFMRTDQTGNLRDKVYITNQMTGVLNSDIYLVLSNKDENATPLYTSYPQLFRLRELLENIKNLIIDNKGFIDADGILSVKQEYSSPYCLLNIGTENKWISFKLVVLEENENGVSRTVPGVSIEMSTSNRIASTLTTDEFLTVYTVIKDLQLSSIQIAMGLVFLQADDYYPQMNNQYNQQPIQHQYAPNNRNQYQPQYNTPYGNQQYQQPYTPRQNQQPQYNNRPVSRQVHQKAAPAPQIRPMEEQNDIPFVPFNQERQNIPPRSNSSFSLDAVNSTEPDKFDLNLQSDVDSIFDEN